MASIAPNLLLFAKAPNFITLRTSNQLAFTPRRSLRLSASADNSSVNSVVNPAFFHANLMHFRSGYNVQIVVEDTESEEALLRRFRREVSKAGVIQECKRRRFFENKQEEKKRKAREAGRRNRRRRIGPRFPSSSPSSADNASGSKKTGDDADDNWEMPDGGLPS